MINSDFVKRHRLSTYEHSGLHVQWAEVDKGYDASLMSCQSVKLFSGSKDFASYQMDSVPLIVAPLRVDAIIGLPFLFRLGAITLGEDPISKFPWFSFTQDDKEYRFLAQQTGPKEEGPHCNAIHLRGFEDKPRRPRGYSRQRKHPLRRGTVSVNQTDIRPPNDNNPDWLMDIKTFRKHLRKGLLQANTSFAIFSPSPGKTDDTGSIRISVNQAGLDLTLMDSIHLRHGTTIATFRNGTLNVIDLASTLRQEAAVGSAPRVDPLPALGPGTAVGSAPGAEPLQTAESQIDDTPGCNAALDRTDNALALQEEAAVGSAPNAEPLQEALQQGAPVGSAPCAEPLQIAKSRVDDTTILHAPVADTDPLASIPKDNFLRSTLETFQETLFKEPSGLPPDRGDANFTHEFADEASRKPSFQPLRHMSGPELEELDRQLKHLLKKGWIRPSNSPWGAPVLFAKKKDGRLRCCIDYRELNRQTRKDRTPLPNLRELRDRITGKQWFTAIDIRDAYHCIRISDKDIEKTAFRTRFGHFEYLVLPFGLTNAPATFQRLMNDLFAADAYDRYMISYLDDILIFSNTEEEHIEHVTKVLSILAEAKLFIMPSKCTWAVTKVEFCGHVISRQGIEIAPSKIQAVQERATPACHWDVQSFLGLTNYLSSWVPDYSQVALPLSRLQSKATPWQWGEAEDHAFRELKRLITEAPVLAHYNPAKPLYVFTDASGFAVGGWLAQPASLTDEHIIPDPIPRNRKALPPSLRPISFFGRKMQPAESRYPVHEQELLALVRCIEANESYLRDQPFRAFSDHQSLVWIQTQPHLSRRQARWVEYLQEFDFKIAYIPGEWNDVADILSRDPSYAPKCASCSKRIDVITQLANLSASVPTVWAAAGEVTTILDPSPLLPHITFTKWKEYQDSDHYATAKIAALAEYGPGKKPEAAKSNHLRRYHVDARGLLYYDGDRLHVPEALRGPVLELFHDSLVIGGHSGIDRTINKLADKAHWPNWIDDLRTWTGSCDRCQRIKTSAGTLGFLRSLTIPREVGHTIGMDWLAGPRVESNGTYYDSVLVIVDYLSSYVRLLKCRKDMTSMELADLFSERYVADSGFPAAIVSDRDPRLVSNFWTELMRMHNTQQALSTARHQQTDGKCENVIKSITRMLAPYLTETKDDFYRFLPFLQYNYNATPHTSGGLSPFEVHLGSIPPLAAPKIPRATVTAKNTHAWLAQYQSRISAIRKVVADSLRAAQDVQATHFDRNHSSVVFETGDRVLLNRDGLNLTLEETPKKFGVKWLGPFTVKDIGPNPDTYTLDLPQALSALHPTFHVNVLKLYRLPSSSKHRPPTVLLPPPTLDLNGDPLYVVERLLDCRWRNREQHFKVRWSGWPPEYDTWEPRSSLEETAALQDWLSEHGDLPPPTPGSRLSWKYRSTSGQPRTFVPASVGTSSVPPTASQPQQTPRPPIVGTPLVEPPTIPPQAVQAATRSRRKIRAPTRYLD